MKLEIFDILQDEYWYRRVIKSIPDIVSSGHYNSRNYSDLESRLTRYDCFTVVVDTDSDTLMAISGLFNGGIYPKNVARVLDRTYYYNWRENLLSPYNSAVQYNTNFATPFQIEFAKTKGYDAVFFSMQTGNKRNAIIAMAKRQVQYKFTVLDGMYNTCPLIHNVANPAEKCWQNIAIHYINETEFLLPKLTIEEYNDTYPRPKDLRDTS